MLGSGWPIVYDKGPTLDQRLVFAGILYYLVLGRDRAVTLDQYLVLLW